MPNMTPWVRQYPLRDLLDDSFDLYKERFATLLLAAVIPFLLVVIYLVLMRVYLFPGNLSQYFPPKNAPPADIFSFFIKLLFENVYLLGLNILCGMALGFANLLQCRLAVRYALGEKVSLWDALPLLGKPFWSQVLIAVLFTPVLVIATFVALVIIVFITEIIAMITGAIGLLISPNVAPIIAGITALLVFLTLSILWTYTVWTPFLAAPVSLTMEKSGPFTAIGRSFSVAFSNFKAHFWSLFIVSQTYLVFFALISVAILLIQQLTSHFSTTMTLMFGSIVGISATCLYLGLQSSLQALAYIDGRCRRENFELRMLARDIGLGEEFEQSFSPGSALPAPAAGFPDYSAAPTKAPIAGTPAAPAAPIPTVPTLPAMAFPDYSAPPPPIEAGEGATDAE